MAILYKDLYLDQGSSFNQNIIVKDKFGNIMNLVNYTISSSAKISYIEPNTVLFFAGSVIDGANGIINLQTSSQNTSNLPIVPSTIVYDVLATDLSNNVTRIVEGKIFIQPGVTGITLSY